MVGKEKTPTQRPLALSAIRSMRLCTRVFGEPRGAALEAAVRGLERVEVRLCFRIKIGKICKNFANF